MDRSAPAPAGRDRLIAAGELLLVVLITLGHRVFHVIPVDEALPILALGWLSLWLRGVGWRGVGLTRPPSWPRAIAAGVATGVLLQALSEFVTEPLLTRLTGQVPDVSSFRPLVGNAKAALVGLAVGWTIAAFGEEMTYRGYVLNRIADLGGRTRGAWAGALILTSALFAFGHSYQGLTGALDVGIHALILGGLYLASVRNLWPVIVAHGTADTIAAGLVYFGRF